MDIRTKMRNPGYRATVGPAELAQDLAQLKTLPKEELLDLALALGDDLLALVNSIPDLILDGLERQLSNDTASADEAAALLQRVSRPTP